MNSHACWPAGTVTPMFSVLPQSPAFVPFPVQVTVPVDAPDGDAANPKDAARAMTVAAVAAAVLKRGRNRSKILIGGPLSSPDRRTRAYLVCASCHSAGNPGSDIEPKGTKSGPRTATNAQQRPVQQLAHNERVSEPVAAQFHVGMGPRLGHRVPMEPPADPPR